MKKTATQKTDYVSPELKVVFLSGESAITTSGETDIQGFDNGKTLGEIKDYVSKARI